MTIYSQRTNGYQNIKLGFGEGTIWWYGCKLVAIAQGLQKFGINFTPPELNALLKDNGLFTGTTKNLINDDQIKKLAFIDSFQRIDSFTIDQLRNLLKDRVVVAEVSPVPLAGDPRSQHFVMVDAVDGPNAIIIDPWFGDRLKVAERYGKHGNIKSLRVYKIVKVASPPAKDTMSEETKKLLEKYGAKTVKVLDERIFEHVGLTWGKEDDLSNKSLLAEDRRKNTRLSIQVRDLKTEMGLLGKEIDTLNGDIGKLNKQVSAHKGEVTKKEKEIVALKLQLEEAKKPNIVKRFTSRKLLLAIAGFLVPILNELLGINLSLETVVMALTSLIAFIGVEGYTDHVVRVANETLEKTDESVINQ